MKRELTVPEAAEYLGVTPKDIRAYIARGELPGTWNKTESRHTRAPRYRIPVASLDNFKESRQVNPPVKRERRRFALADVL